MFIRSLLLAALLLLPAPTAAADLLPIGKWMPYFTEKQCLVRRKFGDPAGPFNIYLKRPAIGDNIQLSVVRPGYARQSERLPVKVTVDGRDLPPTTAFITNVLSDEVRWHVINLPLSEFQDPRPTVTIGVKTEGLNQTFSVPGFALIMRLLDGCVTKLRTTWHVDGSGALVDLAQPPRNDDYVGFRPEDYPPSALDNEMEGTVTVTYLIAETGRVVDCMITSSAGSPALDERTCGIIVDRARFIPALGLDGKPAKAAGRQRVTWKLD